MKPDLYMRSLQLENFRGFKELSLDLHPRLNVFLGNNGAGKSSILEAFNITLGYITDTLGDNTVVKTTINYEDVHRGAANCKIMTTMFDGYDIPWAIQAKPTIENGKRQTECNLGTPDIIKYINKLKQYILYPQTQNNLPVFISYQATRDAFAHIASNDTRIADFSNKACYDDAISRNPGYGNFFEWFKSREDLENETKVKNQNLQYVDPQLHTVRHAMSHCLEFSSFAVDRTHWTFNLKKNNQEFYFNQLSDGEKGYLLLVADIARRLAIANPHANNLLNGKGIVIIDEIELHLHPKWQRQIISQLMNTFTGCQFIITTHSPQVIGEVATESIWILEEGQAPYHPERSYGMDSSELLKEVMDAPTMNEDVLQQLLHIEKLIDAEDYDKARQAISNLAKKTKDIPALIGMNALLTMEGEEQANIDG